MRCGLMTMRRIAPACVPSTSTSAPLTSPPTPEDGNRIAQACRRLEPAAEKTGFQDCGDHHNNRQKYEEADQLVDMTKPVHAADLTAVSPRSVSRAHCVAAKGIGIARHPAADKPYHRAAAVSYPCNAVEQLPRGNPIAGSSSSISIGSPRNRPDQHSTQRIVRTEIGKPPLWNAGQPELVSEGGRPGSQFVSQPPRMMQLR